MVRLCTVISLVLGIPKYFDANLLCVCAVDITPARALLKSFALCLKSGDYKESEKVKCVVLSTEGDT